MSCVTDTTDEDTFWISGGHTTTHPVNHKSSEYVTINGESVLGSDLPFSLVGHCVTLWDENTILINGGYLGYGWSSSTWLLDLTTEIWTPGYNSAFERERHSCGVMNREDTGEKIVVMVASLEIGTYDSKITEVISDVYGPWENGKHNLCNEKNNSQKNIYFFQRLVESICPLFYLVVHP
jgi:hypothetical protein